MLFNLQIVTNCGDFMYRLPTLIHDIRRLPEGF